MKYTKVEFEFDGYEIAAVAAVKEGKRLLDFSVSFVGVPESERPDKDTVTAVRELAAELLIEEAYCPEVE